MALRLSVILLLALFAVTVLSAPRRNSYLDDAEFKEKLAARRASVDASVKHEDGVFLEVSTRDEEMPVEELEEETSIAPKKCSTALL